MPCRLKIDPPITVTTHPWQLTKSTTPLDLEMVDGILFSSAAATGISTPQTVSTDPLTLTNGTQNLVQGGSTLRTWFYLHTLSCGLDAVTVEDRRGSPADTLDLEDIESGAGNVFVEIGGGGRSGRCNNRNHPNLTRPLHAGFPLAIDLEEFGVPGRSPHVAGPYYIMPNGKLPMIDGKPVFITEAQFLGCCCSMCQ